MLRTILHFTQLLMEIQSMDKFSQVFSPFDLKFHPALITAGEILGIDAADFRHFRESFSLAFVG